MRFGIAVPADTYFAFQQHQPKMERINLVVGDIQKGEEDYFLYPFKKTHRDSIDDIVVFGESDGYEYTLSAQVETDHIYTRRDTKEIPAASFLEGLDAEKYKVSGGYKKLTFHPNSVRKFVCNIKQGKTRLPGGLKPFIEELSSFIYQVETAANNINRVSQKYNVNFGKDDKRELFVYPTLRDFISRRRPDVVVDGTKLVKFYHKEVPIARFYGDDKKLRGTLA